jgi:sirohydrochlorin ferrochelatase
MALMLILVVIQAATGQHSHPRSAPKATPANAAKIGVLLLAHGGKPDWNLEVSKLAAQVNRTLPIEVAFGMASKRTMEEAIHRLVARGVQQIVAVPLFVSSHSSVITSTEYLLGLRSDAPPELASFARMDHAQGAASHAMMMDASFDPSTPIKSPVPIRMTSALNHHPLVAEILLERARSISKKPESEVVVVVAHGPVPDNDNAKWLADMHSLAERMRAASRFKRIEYLTVRDDAPEEVRAKATAELRNLVERATVDSNRVLVVPLLLSYGGIELGIKKRLEGLTYTMSSQGLLPDNRLAEWVLVTVRGDNRN